MGRGAREFDFVIIGGGFYGASLALYLRSISKNICLIETEEELLTRASRVNQARVHTGFHYPRSFVTGYRSLALHQRFITDFPDAIVDDFKMLYAVARRRSKVSAGRFYRMYAEMGAPIQQATREEAALFSAELIENVFECREFAFDYTVLRGRLLERMERYGIEMMLGTSVESIDEGNRSPELALSTGEEIRAGFVFNVTYSAINQILTRAKLPLAPLKHEFTEVALVVPPSALNGYGVTVMDGPFFSAMPYPAEDLYSLTHVRYTPQFSWVDKDVASPGSRLPSFTPESHVQHMILDAQRYLPCMKETRWVRSIYDTKTVLIRNEGDDGRPILFQRQPNTSRIISVMGGKVDNIYDLFELMRRAEPAWANADGRYLWGNDHG